MTEIKIDKNVPVPEPKYPYRKLQVGDSFFIPKSEMPQRQAPYGAAKHAGIKIVSRVVTENGVEGVRVWRIADEKPPQKIRAA